MKPIKWLYLFCTLVMGGASFYVGWKVTDEARALNKEPPKPMYAWVDEGSGVYHLTIVDGEYPKPLAKFIADHPGLKVTSHSTIGCMLLITTEAR